MRQRRCIWICLCTAQSPHCFWCTNLRRTTLSVCSPKKSCRRWMVFSLPSELLVDYAMRLHVATSSLVSLFQTTAAAGYTFERKFYVPNETYELWSTGNKETFLKRKRRFLYPERYRYHIKQSYEMNQWSLFIGQCLNYEEKKTIFLIFCNVFPYSLFWFDTTEHHEDRIKDFRTIS